MPFPDWIMQYELCFPIASEHFGPARLRITPTGYEKDTNGNLSPSHRNRVYGLYITARFEDDGRELKYEISDFVTPEFFQELERFIVESTNHKPKAQLQGEDGYLDLSFHRIPDGKLRILCVSPSPGWSVNCLRLQLECHVNSEALFEIGKQLGKLLDLIKEINSGSKEA